MTKTRTIAVLLAGLGLTGMVTATATQAASDDVSCEIERSEGAGGTLYSAVVEGPRGFYGSYDLSVDKSGGGGTASTTQSGDFEIASGEAVVLSEVGIDSGGSVDVDVLLTVMDEDGSVICEAD